MHEEHCGKPRGAAPGRPSGGQDAVVQDEPGLARMIVSRSPVILFKRLPSPDPRLVFVSENISRFGYSAADFLEERVTWRDIVLPEDMERMRREILDHADAGSDEYSQEYRIVTRGGEVRWVHDVTTAVRGADGKIAYYQGVATDVTERKLAELSLRESEERHRRILETAAEGFMLLDPDLRIVEVNEAYARMLGYPRDALRGKTPAELATPEYARWLARNREVLLSHEHRIFEGTLRGREGRTVPVLIHANTLRDVEGRVEGHVAFVTDLTEQKRSLRLAAEVQRSLLPSEMPVVAGLDVAARSVPCEDLGGDYFDLVAGQGPDGAGLTAAVGDISGHGVDSALLMAAARGSVRQQLASGAELGAALAATNRDLFRDFLATSRFMTLLAVRLDGGGNLEWARAGQDPPLLYDPREDAFASLLGEGLPLGVLEDAPYAQEHYGPLPPGTVLALGTDGIWEASDQSGELFGKDRFMDAVRRSAQGSAAEIVEAVFAAVSEFQQALRPQDDITLVVVKTLA
ncbi:putative PAS/PAC sensor protein [Desulfovibrio sp. X2]|uniref:PP2C family protein-serine/threonine phosphatase n=1 Tax=Desulfovibrio sp. X2 TaxID=941449 RepID=UPI000358EDF3|nr:SpoIIE family protein phosphatase [Desulfovibrio sp. X2]EPR44671.1 putative PAS/PAC sensor protein [Desulfovibrio sp. X2]